jgi:hypothetical protein
MCANARDKSSRTGARAHVHPPCATPRAKNGAIASRLDRAHRDSMHKPIASVVVAFALTATATAAAQYPPPALPAPPAPGYGYSYPPSPPSYMPPRPRFGSQGQLAISGDANADFLGRSVSNNGGSSWEFNLHPAADYFVIQGLSIGGFLDYTHTSTSSSDALGHSTTDTTDSFGIGARVGYNIPFSDALSWWPKGGLEFVHTSNAGAGSVLTLVLFAPLLYHPVSHFFFGLGPIVSTDLSSSPTNGQPGDGPKFTTYGVAFTIGGWFLLG